MNAVEFIDKNFGINKEEQMKIFEEVRENRRKQENCSLHDFEKESDKLGSKYICKNCGCRVDSNFVTAYQQGLKHGAVIKC
jgi:hypothetical protein